MCVPAELKMLNFQPTINLLLTKVESQDSFYSEERGTLQGQGHNLGRKTRHAHEPSQPEHPEVEGLQHKAMFPFKLFGASLHLKSLKPEHSVANLSLAKV